MARQAATREAGGTASASVLAVDHHSAVTATRSTCASPQGLQGVDRTERPVKEVADHRRGLVVADGLGDRRPLAVEVVHEVAAPALVVLALGGLDACDDSAVLAHLGRGDGSAGATISS